MKLAITVLLLACIIVLPSGSKAQYTGVVSVDSVTVKKGEQVAVGVRLRDNTEDIAGMQVPLRIDASAFAVDSVSFVGSIKPINFSSQLYFDSYSDAWLVHIIPPIGGSGAASFSTSGGLLFTVFLTTDSEALPQTYPVDSANVDSVLNLPGGTEIHKWRRVMISDADAQMFFPDFEPGKVVVLALTGVNDGGGLAIPEEFALSQNYPNPFNPTTEIEFALPRSGRVRLDVFNVLGQKIETLVDGYLPAGLHQASFDASSQPSGVYFYRLLHEEGSETRKMLLVK